MYKRSILVSKAFKEMNKSRPDMEKSFSWLSRAAGKNDFEALYAIGTWYLHGRFVKKSSKIAVQYFQKSITGNCKAAFYDLAICYEKGTGTHKNKKAAFACYLNAAFLGDKQSFYEVGRCYYYGIGTAKNKVVAEIWLEHAKLAGIF